MSKKTVAQCKTWREVDHWVRNNPNVVEIRQTGSHVCVKGPKPGTAVYPLHNGDAPNGTLKSFIKMAMAIGLLVLLLGCLAIASSPQLLAMAMSGN
jgi:hypothetical protein